MPNLELKQRQVDELAEQLQQAELTVLADYRGLTVAEMSRLRGRLRDAGGQFHVAKNTLTRRAAERLGYDELVPYLVGPTGLATGQDPAALAKALQDYGRTQRTFVVKGAVLGSRVLPAAEVNRLADLPSREQLIAQVIGGFQAPIAGLVNVLNGTLRSFVGVLEARRQQLEGQGGGA
ncbi:MAG TPA: 50S ribosomal protein L10 [Chloroflexota bacterium]|nr:50S ribosomal protein L10 [Chloroflexota bacterium]